MQVVPAIFPASYDEVLEKAATFSQYAHLIQIDISDGVVGEQKTWQLNSTEELPHFDGTSYQLDLMVEDWRTVVKESFQLKQIPASYVFHVDTFTVEDVADICEAAKVKQVEVGFSVTNDTPAQALTPLVEVARSSGVTPFIQVMGIDKIGAQGKEFDGRCLLRIKQLKALFGDLLIQVDGAMRPETAELVSVAGAERIVVGSYLSQHGDVSVAFESLAVI